MTHFMDCVVGAKGVAQSLGGAVEIIKKSVDMQILGD